MLSFFTRRRARHCRSRAFTLIELLVVIAIIAVLAAILFPVFAQAREKARQTTCLSNQKQIGLGMMMYLQDYDETYPLAFGNYDGYGWLWGLAHDTPADWENIGDPEWVRQSAVSWANSIQPYVKNYAVYLCPSAADQIKLDPWGWNYDNPLKAPEPTSLTYNGLLMAYPQAGMPSPASVPLITEGIGKSNYLGAASSFPELACDDPTQACIYQPRTAADCAPGNGGQSYSGTYGQTRPTLWIHNQGMNMTFADGHAAWRRLGAVLAPGNTDGNRDPFTNYQPDGSADTVWSDGCHQWLFRPNFTPR